MNAYDYDGKGRDMYIGFNNGGFWNTRVPPGTSLEPCTERSTKYRFKWPSKDPVSFTYRSDGSGRDSYILIDSGGLNRQSKPLCSYSLSDFLRGDDFGSQRRTYSSGFNTSKYQFSRNKALRQTQKNVVDRLYNKEKYKFIPGM